MNVVPATRTWLINNKILFCCATKLDISIKKRWSGFAMVPLMPGSFSMSFSMDCAGSKAGNKGYDCALGAVEMVNLIRQI